MLSLFFTLTFYGLIIDEEYGSYSSLLLLVCLGSVGSQTAILVANFAISRLLPPYVIPRLDFSSGIPDEHRTMVVIPCMLTSLEGVKELLLDL
jgi:cyclic beta-1,2-glucan synthetase